MNAGADERERFNFTMFLSVAAHGILIFGISFGAVQSTSEVPTLEITLAAHHSEIAPNRADFLAQANQLGSGSLAEDAPAVAPTSPFQADYESATLQAAQPMAPEQTATQREGSTELRHDVGQRAHTVKRRTDRNR